MTDAPDFEKIARRVVSVGSGPVLVAQLADELRLMWNTRGKADVTLLEGEIPKVWTMAEPAGLLTRALRTLDR